MSVRPLLLGFTVPDEMAEELFATDPIPAVQTHRFAWSLARALNSAFGEVRLLSGAPVQSWPHTPHILHYRRDIEQEGIAGITLGFINVVGLKHVSRFITAFVQTRTVLARWRMNTVFIHGVHTPWLAYGRVLQALGLPVVTILTDPPGIIRAIDDPLSRWLKGFDRWIVDYFVSRASALVALAPDLVAAYPGVARSLVFPGIVNSLWLEQLDAVEAAAPGGRPFTVVYAGGVNATYGVDRLLDAAKLAPEIRFVILGKGDQVERIASEGLSNVFYGGFVSAIELVQEIRAADLLINPRPSDTDFARSSFPSKLLEYAVSGLPVLTTRISSIPDIIEDCYFYIDDEDPAGIARAIQNVAAQPTEKRLAFARQSRTAIIAEYSEEAVGRKLADLVSTFATWPAENLDLPLPEPGNPHA